MTNETKHPKEGTPGRRLRPLLWVAANFAVFYLLFFDPLGVHPVDGWLQRALGYHTGPMAHADASADGSREVLFYRNPMDPTITSPVPAKDEMGMDYLPVYADGPAAAESGPREVLFYRNPMDPTITSPVPAKDEMGMDYIPVYADGAAAATGAEATTVTIEAAVVQNMNVQSVPVERRDLSHEIRTVGYLEYDQERMVTVTTKYTGWVEKVYVNYVGEPVRRGQPLFEIYSPELVQTEQELLSAIEYAARFEGNAQDASRRASALVDAARTRLSYWDIAPEQIARLEETGEIFRTLKVVAPAGGVVMKRMPGLEGMAVRPGMETYHIADLSTLWLSVEVFEDQVAWIREGTPADVTFTYFPGETFAGKVRFIEPEFSEKTRTLRVKLEVPNRDGKLRSGMFATVTFHPVAAHEALAVPSLAVLRTGQRNVVIVDQGGGRFQPRAVTLGHEGDGWVQVLDGIREGERVVTSSQFLIDSEANLQAAIQKMITQQGAGAGMAPIEAPAADAEDAPPEETPHAH